ncbi:hypothetical protein D9Q98_006996 [Chlorella vulgaris]|uniref:JmjC domain-containing protein n=1 Tax=Chlorella vulgaris TaxID=3077 RepID=A0A9D4YUT3_CHLVU|nr:hypothetical protein D9Q98_006996 [Chlorella vulgaris]
MRPVPIGGAVEAFKSGLAARKPTLFDSLPADLEHLQHLWTDAYLTKAAGDTVLQVEQRGGEGQAFGKGDASKATLTLAAALARMAAGDTSLYITTQAVPTAPDGHPALYAPLIRRLAADLPVAPQLTANLVPQSINLWCGAATQGSSSGLHCDYHDNLYVLLRGRKRFRLYPPSQAPRMYTVGRPAVVHPNGRIVFRGQGDIQADGSEAGDAARWLARHEAEAELAAAESAATQGLPGASKRLRAAEQRLDAVLEAALEGDGDDFAGFDDFDALEAQPVDQASPPPLHAAAAGDPESFSRVDLSLPDSELRRRFPRFPGKDAALVCEVAAGQMLYLPAGWFHEVTSFSEPGCPTHMALNWWFHPPDNLGGGGAAAAAKPYRSGYWPAVWEGRRAEYEARHRKATGQQQGQQQGEAQPLAAVQGDAARSGRKRKAGGEVTDAAAAATVQHQDALRACRHGGSMRQQTLPRSYGLFGVGRRQHLHRFVMLRTPR